MTPAGSKRAAAAPDRADPSGLPRGTRPETVRAALAPRTLVEEVATKLRQAIFSGKLQPGHRLVEIELCATLGVSRPALREAFRVLQTEQLCEIMPHRGAQVATLSWKDAEDIYHVRAMLEGEAAALAATHITPEELNELRGALADFGKAVHTHDPHRRVEATSRFYAQVLRSSRNGVIEEMLLRLLARVNFLRSRSMSRSGRAWRSYLEITAILEAIESRRPEAAREAAVAHVRQAKDAAQALFAKDAEDRQAYAGGSRSRDG